MFDNALVAAGLSAQIFTQISDVECEQSGLLTYDRLQKADADAIAATNTELLRNASARGWHPPPPSAPSPLAHSRLPS